MLHFKLLGPLEVAGGGSAFAPTAPRVLNTLALLLVRGGRVVPLDTIIEELWGDDPPRSAARTAQTYVYQIRRWLTAGAAPAGDEDVLLTRPPGYLLRVAPEQLDLSRFDRLLAEGRALLQDGRAADAVDPLCRALDLWTGPPMANVELGRVLESHAAALDEHRAHALNLRIEADLRLGRHRELIGELRSLVALKPYDEWYHTLLVCALARSGRRYDALEAFHAARHILAEDLGLSPSPELSEVHTAVLQGEQPRTPLACTEGRAAAPAGPGAVKRAVPGPRPPRRTGLPSAQPVH
ncbi:AfsR/SARP family transcriptional regulator [Actinomadura bangladeshensis]|uniref:SARP family transcriptional regulator n=1 Tax=Actinomadura bangladeshensis TaxID=453573 RepID=A0A4R4PBL8_9ACTN|nr:AfsR/SARP family transcriptional regulator [Actinomadura bangladeshensis]TDC19805.1 SARP family transcriptional regulator [Actinomadura bangladeshensis]